MNLGRDDDRIRRSYKSILHDRLADLAGGHFGSQGLAMEDYWLMLSVVYIH